MTAASYNRVEVRSDAVWNAWRTDETESPLREHLVFTGKNDLIQSEPSSLLCLNAINKISKEQTPASTINAPS